MPEPKTKIRCNFFGCRERAVQVAESNEPGGRVRLYSCQEHVVPKGARQATILAGWGCDAPMPITLEELQ